MVSSRPCFDPLLSCPCCVGQIMRNTLYKAYLDDFAAFCEKLGGTTAEVMSDLLAFEADRRALNITLNRWAPQHNTKYAWQ